MMSFLSAVVTSRYPTTNNQLRNSLNPRQQETINDGRVTLQPVQGRKISFATGTSRIYTPGASGSNSGKQRTVTCYNYKGEGHMSKQCTKPKRKRDDLFLRWVEAEMVVPRLKVRNREDFSYIRCMMPLVYQLMAVKNTSFPEMECSGSVVVNIPDVVED
ncbi:integrase, catalytic region, zinc finger, CCHC-type containing protein [Tanacetum coccineum]